MKGAARMMMVAGTLSMGLGCIAATKNLSSAAAGSAISAGVDAGLETLTSQDSRGDIAKLLRDDGVNTGTRQTTHAVIGGLFDALEEDVGSDVLGGEDPSLRRNTNLGLIAEQLAYGVAMGSDRAVREINARADPNQRVSPWSLLGLSPIGSVLGVIAVLAVVGSSIAVAVTSAKARRKTEERAEAQNRVLLTVLAAIALREGGDSETNARVREALDAAKLD